MGSFGPLRLVRALAPAPGSQPHCHCRAHTGFVMQVQLRWALVAVLAASAVLKGADGAVAFAANLIACGSIATGCNHTLPVSVNQPLGGTDPYYLKYCSGSNYTCLPVSYPVGDWVSSTVQPWRYAKFRSMQRVLLHSCVAVQLTAGVQRRQR